jgi:PTH1 family peptidyl-tRNA hydrolase
VWLVAGLGNPGSRYARNRHNIGFMVIDELARRGHQTGFRSKFGAEATTCMVAGSNALLLKPMEYMNHSGFAVQRAAHFHNAEVDEVIVVHDEIDLDFGRLRLKTGGGHGGHNGLRSIIAQLGSRDFLRVRVGVGKPQSGANPAQGADSRAAGGDRKVASWVLSDFPSNLASDVDELINRAADATEAIIREGIRGAMNEYNRKPEPAQEAN